LAQPPGPIINIELIGPEQGLPNRNTRCIMQDALGFLWLGVGDGLWRYDGYTFQSYTDLLTRTSGFITLINDIQRGPDDRLWIAHNNGISVIDPARLTCVHVDLARTFPDRLYSNQTVKIHFDRQGNAWVALPGAALVKVDQTLRPLLLYVPPENKMDSTSAARFISKLFQDGEKNIYLFSKDNFLEIIDGNGRYIRRVELSNAALQKNGFVVADVLGSGKESLLICYGNEHTKKKKVRTFSFLHQILGPLAENPYSINPENRYTDKKGFAWYKSYNQVGFLQEKTGIFTHVTDLLRQKAGVELYFFNALVVSDNSFWLCSGAGLFKITITEQFFQKFLSIPLQKPTDVGTSMRGITEDSTGTIWTCSYGFKENGSTYLLHKLDPKTGAIQHLKPKLVKDGQYINPMPYKIVFGKNGVYAITDATYLLKMAPGSLQSSAIDFTSTTGNEFTCLYSLDDSTLWMGTLSGMAMINTRKLQPVLFNHQAGAYIRNVRVNFFMPWSSDQVLASTTNGLYVLDKKARIVDHYGAVPEDQIRLPSLRIFHTVWYGASLWAGSADGLMRIDTLLKKAELFTTKEGLPDNMVYAALPDDRGNLWLSTNNGLCRFNTKTKKVHNYGLADGLPHTEFNHTSFLKAEDGKLYFGGLNGIVGFDPATLNSTTREDALLRLISYSKYVGGTDSVETVMSPAVQDKIVFGAGDRLFSFSFMSPDYRHTNQNRFRYKLEGWDDEAWHSFETGNKLTFNNLLPGSYTLHVQVSVAGGDWSKQEWRVVLEVKAPWYKTAWFFMLSLITVALIFYAFYRYRLAQILRIQQIRNRISADMHDEIGSTLSSITFYSQALLLQTAEKKQKDVLQKIKENAQQVQEGLSDIVWSVKASLDKIENVFARMHSFGSELLESKGISLHFEQDETLNAAKLDMVKRKNFYLIFKEAVNNAAKYAHCKNLWVQINGEEGRIKMVIKDDGRGFDPQQAKQGNGLSNMQARAVQMKSRLTVASSEGNGTTITLIL